MRTWLPCSRQILAVAAVAAADAARCEPADADGEARQPWRESHCPPACPRGFMGNRLLQRSCGRLPSPLRRLDRLHRRLSRRNHGSAVLAFAWTGRGAAAGSRIRLGPARGVVGGAADEGFGLEAAAGGSIVAAQPASTPNGTLRPTAVHMTARSSRGRSTPSATASFPGATTRRARWRAAPYPHPVEAESPAHLSTPACVAVPAGCWQISRSAVSRPGPSRSAPLSHRLALSSARRVSLATSVRDSGAAERSTPEMGRLRSRLSATVAFCSRGR